MSNLAPLVLIGGGAYAWSQGWLDRPIAAVLDAIDATPKPGRPDAPERARRPLDDPPAALVPPVTEAEGDSMTEEESLLRDHWDFVGDWSRRNVKWTAALIWQESRGRPGAMGPVITRGMHKGDRAHGLMQVMPLTAKDLYNWGWNRMQPTSANLRTPYGSIYFGTAYLDWLDQTYGKDRVWMTHAYNGGPGWTELQPGSANYRQNQGYVAAIRQRHAQIA